MNPKVFISHASEDKERFVLKFSARLREDGIDAWLDQWEMLPGDSLIDKIFEEGLKEAKAVIVVLSKFSVDKPWVREELNTSIVQRLSKGTKVIPVVLDKCEVPAALDSTLWENIEDVDSYDTSFRRIVSSITGANDKPALGSLPEYAGASYSEIAGLTKIDNLILKEVCDVIFAKDTGDFYINPDEVFGKESKLGISKSEIEESFEMLESIGYFEISHFMGGIDPIFGCHVSVTTAGFNAYAETYVKDYENLLEKVVSALVNEKIESNSVIAEKLGASKVMIDHIFLTLESSSLIKLSKFYGSEMIVDTVSISLKRGLL